jgi:thioredoxin
VGSVASVTDSSFEQEVLKAEKPVLVDFWATWCAPCRMIAPVVDELHSELGDRVRIVKMDTDANPQTPSTLGIMSIPTLIIFKDGRPVDRTIGYRSNLKSDLKQKLEALL